MTARGGRGWFKTDLTAAQRRARIVELHDGGMTFQDIATELGFTSKGGICNQYQRALREVPSEAVAVHRVNETARLLTNIARLTEAFDDAKDPSVVAVLCREIRRHSESLRRLHGTDAPVKRVIEVITQDVVDAEIERLNREMAELDASADQQA